MKKYTYLYKLFKHFKALLPALRFTFTILKYAYLAALAIYAFQITILGFTNESYLLEGGILAVILVVKTALSSMIQKVSLFLIKQFCNPEEVLDQLEDYLNKEAGPTRSSSTNTKDGFKGPGGYTKVFNHLTKRQFNYFDGDESAFLDKVDDDLDRYEAQEQEETRSKWRKYALVGLAILAAGALVYYYKDTLLSYNSSEGPDKPQPPLDKGKDSTLDYLPPADSARAAHQALGAGLGTSDRKTVRWAIPESNYSVTRRIKTAFLGADLVNDIDNGKPLRKALRDAARAAELSGRSSSPIEVTNLIEMDSRETAVVESPPDTPDLAPVIPLPPSPSLEVTSTPSSPALRQSDLLTKDSYNSPSPTPISTTISIVNNPQPLVNNESSLAAWVSSQNPTVIGITGNPEEVYQIAFNAAIKTFKVIKNPVLIEHKQLLIGTSFLRDTVLKDNHNTSMSFLVDEFLTAAHVVETFSPDDESYSVMLNKFNSFTHNTKFTTLVFEYLGLFSYTNLNFQTDS